jgi:uncharacterized repeat protein (TIGR01451 family)
LSGGTSLRSAGLILGACVFLLLAGLAQARVRGAVDLSVTLRAAPDPVAAGQNLTYATTVGNGGPDEAADVALSIALPPTRGFLAVSTNPPVRCTTDEGTERCTLGKLSSGMARTVKIVIRPRAAGLVRATATVSSTGSDANAANNTATVATTVKAPLRLTVFDVARVPKLPRAGEKFYMALAVRRSDTGADLAAGVVICRATVTGRRVRLLVRDSYPSPTCVWRVPERTAGKVMRGSVVVRFRGASTMRRFALPVR